MLLMHFRPARQWVFTQTHTHTVKQAGVIILMSSEEWAAISHDLFSVVLPSVRHKLSHRTGRADPEVLDCGLTPTSLFSGNVSPKQTRAESSEESESPWSEKKRKRSHVTEYLSRRVFFLSCSLMVQP